MILDTTTTKILNTYQNGDFTCTLYDDGTFVKQSTVDNPQAAFPSTIDIKLTNYCDLGCAWCFEDSTEKGVHGDLLALYKELLVLPAGIEVALGGGNPLAHPDLIDFLCAMQKSGIHCNITINEGHLVRYQYLIEDILAKGLVKGIGISVAGGKRLPHWILKAAGDNLVLHMIIGVHRKAHLEFMLSHTPNAKILLLGYKSSVGRGIEYYNRTVERNIEDWFIHVRSFFGQCVLSFDNLAIQQLRLERFFSTDAWSHFYMGNDFTSSMYIDAVEQQYAPTSRSLKADRTSYTNLLEYWKNTHGSLTQNTQEINSTTNNTRINAIVG